MKSSYFRKKWLRQAHADNPNCFYCGELTVLFHGVPTTEYVPERASVDHYYPLARGGEDQPSNYRLSCTECNLAKGSTWPTVTDGWPWLKHRALREKNREGIERMLEQHERAEQRRLERARLHRETSATQDKYLIEALKPYVSKDQFMAAVAVSRQRMIADGLDPYAGMSEGQRARSVKKYNNADDIAPNYTSSCAQSLKTLTAKLFDVLWN